ncbi:helix-turn-helix domain-containing protein [Stutzerimonas kirkiae]|uniref:helix-turn-helix domain-containing protein n=1 Tax=Stutzerimonas kirkiae TaxID=2211392 RepID=UPI00103838BA|nr:helix-turn-helix transcriptional regulator [Stutzerimonas kirkiae]TBV11344.1 transcriptional regulator [Stutzerimonas kirkiae]
MPFTKRLKEARRAVGVSQEKLGLEIGLDPAVASARMNQYERGVHFPNLGTLQQIAGALRLPLAYFFCESDEEARMLKLLHSLTTDQKHEAIRLVEALVAAGSERASES